MVSHINIDHQTVFEKPSLVTGNYEIDSRMQHPNDEMTIDTKPKEQDRSRRVKKRNLKNSNMLVYVPVGSGSDHLLHVVGPAHVNSVGLLTSKRSHSSDGTKIF